MLRAAKFAFLAGLSAAISVAVALDPPPKQDHSKQQDAQKKAEPAKKKNAPSTGERLDRRNIRMKERNREVDGLVNKKK